MCEIGVNVDASDRCHSTLHGVEQRIASASQHGHEADAADRKDEAGVESNG
jgi:exonuclease VII small subunit